MTNAENKQEKARLKTDEDPYYRLKINKIIEATMRKYTSLYTYNTLRPNLRNHIEQRVCEKLSDLHTPDHPTYALMIWRAIQGLNEEEGSTEEAISKFIKEDVEDLPWAHASFLRHHLNKLSESGEIVKAAENCYMLPVGNKGSLLKRKRGQLNGTEDQIQAIEEQKPAEERSEQEPHVNHIEKQIQLQEEQILLIEKLIELQWQKNEVIEKQNKLQTEVRSKMIGLSDLHLSKEPENGEAIVTTQSSSLTGQRLENDGSSFLSKDKYIELLKRTKKITEQLMDIINSSSVRQVSKLDTLKPVMEEQEKENLKKPEHKQQIEFSNQRRPPRHEVETLKNLSKNKMRVKKFCGQQEAPECQPKPTGSSSDVLTNSRQLKNEQQQELKDSERGLELGLKAIETENVGQEASISKTSLDVPSRQLEMEKQLDFPEGHPELCSQQMPLELLPVMSSLDVPSDSRELEQVEQLELPHSGSSPLLKSSRVEPSGQKDEQQQATLHSKGKARDYQLEQEQQQTQGQGASQPELAVDNAIKKSLPSQHHHELQQLKHKDQASPLKLKPEDTAFGELLSSHDMHHHRQLPQEGQGWERPHRQNGDEDQTNVALSPTAHRNQCVQQQLEFLGQGRQLSSQGQGGSQPELVVNDTMSDSLPSKNWHEQQQQQQLKRKGRGRPLKLKPDLHVALGGLLLSDVQHHHGQQLPKHRSRGRPPKSKGDIDPTTIVPLPTALQNQNDHQKAECQGQARRPTPKRKADVALQVSIPLGNQKHNELQQQQPERRGRGRPPKPKPVLATTMEASLPSQQQEQLKHRGRGRPPKRKLDADSMMGEPLTSNSKQKQPKHQGRGRPSKVN